MGVVVILTDEYVQPRSELLSSCSVAKSSNGPGDQNRSKRYRFVSSNTASIEGGVGEGYLGVGEGRGLPKVYSQLPHPSTAD